MCEKSLFRRYRVNRSSSNFAYILSVNGLGEVQITHVWAVNYFKTQRDNRPTIIDFNGCLDKNIICHFGVAQ